MNEKAYPTGIKCPECGKGQLVTLVRDEDFDFDLGDEVVRVHARDVPVERCDSCGEEMSGPKAAAIRHDAICRAAGLLTPSEIKAIREQFGWTQQQLADLTDAGVASISRWERGRLLQNHLANGVLRDLRDCPEFRKHREKLLGKGKDPRPSPTPPIVPPRQVTLRRIETMELVDELKLVYLHDFSRN